MWTTTIKCLSKQHSSASAVLFAPSREIIIIENTRKFGRSNIMANKNAENPSNLVAIEEVRRFMTDCFTATKVNQSNAKQMADLLVEADYRGHFSHGMNRLEMYINELLVNTTDGNAKPAIIKQTPATAWVDGNNGLGAVVGNFCMDLAIEKAKQVGVGWVCAKRSNHYGIAGWYAIRAQKQGFIGMSMTNTSPLMIPTRGKEPVLGTNPLSFAAPANDGDSFVLDMATTSVALGKVEIQRRKQEPIPLGWAADKDGCITTSSDVAFEAGNLLPLGGAEETSGFKGYGLAGMVETLCGISAGARFSTNIRKWSLSGGTAEANLAQVFIAVNPDSFAPDFTDRMTEMNNICRHSAKIDEKVPVLVAGDPERIHMAKINDAGGVCYTKSQIETCARLSERLQIKPLAFI